MNKIFEFALGFIGANWRTTLLGWLVILDGIGGALTATAGFVKALIDNDPNTNMDFSVLADAWKNVAIGVGFLLTRDAKVTSEASGAK